MTFELFFTEAWIGISGAWQFKKWFENDWPDSWDQKGCFRLEGWSFPPSLETKICLEACLLLFLIEVLFTYFRTNFLNCPVLGVPELDVWEMHVEWIDGLASSFEVACGSSATEFLGWTLGNFWRCVRRYAIIFRGWWMVMINDNEWRWWACLLLWKSPRIFQSMFFLSRVRPLEFSLATNSCY